MIGEFFKIIFSFNIKKIFKEPTLNPLLQFFRYAFVGAIATVGDWGLLYVLEHLGVNKYLAVAAGFLLGLAINFLLSKRFVFSAEDAKVNAAGEFIVYGIIGIAGLAITEGIMYVLTEKLSFYLMAAKAVSTVIVFVWNFTARKMLLYSGSRARRD